MTAPSINEAVFQALLDQIDKLNEIELVAYRKLSSQFKTQYILKGDYLWTLDDKQDRVFFIHDGIFAEYLQKQKGSHVVRFYQAQSFAFSEDTVLYDASPETFTKCIASGMVASVPYEVLSSIASEYHLGFHFLESLVQITMKEYRQSTYEMLQTIGTHRLHAAQEKFPEILDRLPRTELAEYLGISRASLFRSLKETSK